MSLKDDIIQCYKEHPQWSGEQIRQHLDQPNTRAFWKAVESVQIFLRGSYASQRKNRGGLKIKWNMSPQAMNKTRTIRFIPPEKKD